MHFASAGTTIKLEVHEPWNAYQILRGQIVRSIKSAEGKVYYLFQGEGDSWLLITARYIGDRIEDVNDGQRVHVDVAALIDSKVLESDCFESEQITYLGIGVIEIEG